MFGKRETKTSDIKAFLGKGSEFEGRLTFREAVRIDGNFKGEIASTDTLIIGSDGVIKAEIEVGSAIISGNVEGNIRAKDKVELHPPARVYGNIKAPRLVILEGAIFEGNCQMENIVEEKKEDMKRPTLLSRLEQ